MNPNPPRKTITLSILPASFFFLAYGFHQFLFVSDLTMSANNTIVDHYAPNWLPFFSRNGEIAAGVEFKVECGICNKRLAISEPADDDDIEDYAILPCQHAFGYDCIKMWKRSSETANCPTCREKLWHSSCEHDFPLRRLKFDGTNVGKAVAECSVPGGLPPLCRDCVSGRRPPRGYDNGRPRRHGTVTDYYEDGASVTWTGLRPNLTYISNDAPSGRYSSHEHGLQGSSQQSSGSRSSRHNGSGHQGSSHHSSRHQSSSYQSSSHHSSRHQDPHHQSSSYQSSSYQSSSHQNPRHHGSSSHHGSSHRSSHHSSRPGYRRPLVEEIDEIERMANQSLEQTLGWMAGQSRDDRRRRR